MRYRGRIKCTLSIASNTYNGTMGTNTIYKSFTKAFSYASTNIPYEWNEVILLTQMVLVTFDFSAIISITLDLAQRHVDLCYEQIVMHSN